MSSKKKSYACSAILAMALQGAAAHAAAINDVPEKTAPEAGIITGHVSDAEHNMLPGASISVKGVKNSVTTDESGYFKISGLKPGRSYELTVSYVGYTPVTKTVEISTKVNENTEFVLADVTSLSEVAVVSPFHGQRKALQMQKQSMGVMNVVSADQVGKFPDSNIGDALKRIILALHRNQNAVRCDERIERQKLKRGRTVDKYVVVVVVDELQGVLEDILTPDLVDKLDGCARQFLVRRYHVAVGSFADAVQNVRSLGYQLVGTRRAVLVNSHAGAAVALRVAVEQKHTLALHFKGAAEIHRRRRFADAALLVRNGDYFRHDLTSCSIIARSFAFFNVSRETF